MKTILGTLGRIPRPTPALGVALLALLIACSGAAVAAGSYTASDGTITACRDNKSGALRVIDAASQSCVSSKETKLTWKDGVTGKVADSLHADRADNATNAANADTVDGKNASDFYAAGSKVAAAARADQADMATSAGDADTLDGKDSTQFADAVHTHSGADITSGTVDADRIEDGSGSGLDADTIDGMNSTEFGAAANNVKVERLELAKPPIGSSATNSEVVFETGAFEILAECKQFQGPTPPPPEEPDSFPVGKLYVVAKEPNLVVRVTRDIGSSTTIRSQILGTGERAIFAGLDDNNPTPIAYGSYFVDAPSSFLEGDGMATFGFDPATGTFGDTCRFSVNGLGKEVSP